MSRPHFHVEQTNGGMVMNIKRLSVIVAALVVTASPVLAQSQDQEQGQTANNSAGAAINQNFEGSPSDQSIDTTPGVYPPAMDAGTNNCAISYSGGGSVTGFGLSFGATVESEDCNERNWIALMSSRGWDDVAKAYACLHNAKMAMAFEAAGYDCPEQATKEQRRVAENKADQNEQAAKTNSTPPYCSDGGWASDDAIRQNCPNADRILNDRGW